VKSICHRHVNRTCMHACMDPSHIPTLPEKVNVKENVKAIKKDICMHACKVEDNDDDHEAIDFASAISLSCEAMDESLFRLPAFARDATSTSALPTPARLTLHPKALDKTL